ncbi:hypothetical protein LOD99_12718 [Oopsacas minuta]|uniref:Basic leucine zipper domain-containing protein n=1 Tax=Oopsacas minuta TaxID=111878 RepID=A0AAV7JCX7_9METZ|nr:hypothetical protein LOD99_12718 [Oopsacas minuta]
MASNITEEEITHMDIKDLNRILKIQNISKNERTKIKGIRRKNKMKKYRRDSRIRTDPKKLQKVKLHLEQELLALAYEVVELRELKDYFISKHARLPDPDNDEDEYGEFVTVD